MRGRAWVRVRAWVRDRVRRTRGSERRGVITSGRVGQRGAPRQARQRALRAVGGSPYAVDHLVRVRIRVGVRVGVGAKARARVRVGVRVGLLGSG